MVTGSTAGGRPGDTTKGEANDTDPPLTQALITAAILTLIIAALAEWGSRPRGW